MLYVQISVVGLNSWNEYQTREEMTQNGVKIRNNEIRGFVLWIIEFENLTIYMRIFQLK